MPRWCKKRLDGFLGFALPKPAGTGRTVRRADEVVLSSRLCHTCECALIGGAVSANMTRSIDRRMEMSAHAAQPQGNVELDL